MFVISSAVSERFYLNVEIRHDGSSFSLVLFHTVASYGPRLLFLSGAQRAEMLPEERSAYKNKMTE